MPIHRAADQARYLAAYWGRSPHSLERACYRVATARFTPSSAGSQSCALWGRSSRDSPSRARPTPTSRRRRPAPRCATGSSGTRSPTSRTSTPAAVDKLGVRLADARRISASCAVVLAAAPRIARRYRELRARALPPAGPVRRPRRRPAPLAALTRGAARRARRRWACARPSCGCIPGRRTTTTRKSWRGRSTRAASSSPSRCRRTASWSATPRAGGPRWTSSARASRPTAEPSRSARRSTAASGGSGTCANTRGWRRSPTRCCAATPACELLGPSVIDFEYHSDRGGAQPAGAALSLRRRLRPALRRPPRRAREPAGRPRHGRQGGAAEGDRRDRAPRTALRLGAEPLLGSPRSTGRCAKARTRRPAARCRSTRNARPTTWCATDLTQATGLVERVFWWQPIAKGYGLVDADPATGDLRRRAAFWAFAHLARRLEGWKSLGPVAAAPDQRVFAFEDPQGGSWWVAWSLRERSMLALERPLSEAFGRDGETLALPGGPEIALGSAPLYLRLATAD